MHLAKANPILIPELPQVLNVQEALMCSLSFAAYFGLMKTVAQEIREELESALKGLGQQLVWGPAINVLEGVTDAMMFVSLSDMTGEYNVVVRGTNPFSFSTWFAQDFDVLPPLYAWKEVVLGQPPIQVPQGENELAISKGACHTLGLLTNLQPDPGLPGEGLYFWEYLGQASVDQSVVINFTGHSLGGLAAPTLALWCIDKFDSWKAKAKNIYVYPFAGPSAGNQAFAEHSDAIFLDREGNSRCTRLVASLDIVPRAFAELQTIGTIYLPQTTPLPIRLVDDALERQVRGIYRQLTPFKEIPSALLDMLCHPKLLESLIFFLLQAVFQHIWSYLAQTMFLRETKLALFVLMVESHPLTEDEHSMLHAKLEEIIAGLRGSD